MLLSALWVGALPTTPPASATIDHTVLTMPEPHELSVPEPIGDKEVATRSVEPVTICTICWDDLPDEAAEPDAAALSITRLPCRHEFHRTCLMDWFRSQDVSPTCPICRTDYSDTDLDTTSMQRAVKRFSNNVKTGLYYVAVTACGFMTFDVVNRIVLRMVWGYFEPENEDPLHPPLVESEYAQYR